MLLAREFSQHFLTVSQARRKSMAQSVSLTNVVKGDGKALKAPLKAALKSKLKASLKNKLKMAMKTKIKPKLKAAFKAKFKPEFKAMKPAS